MGAYRPVVAFDIDGVLANFTEGFCELAVKLGVTDKAIKAVDQRTWEFDFHVDPVWAEIDKSGSFWENLPPLINQDDLDAMDAVNQEATVIYVTARHGGYRVAEQTMEWLATTGCPQGPLFLPGTKASKVGSFIPIRHQLIGVIDDRPETLAELAAEGLPVVARTWEYNKNVPVPHVPSVAAFVERLGIKVSSSYGYQPMKLSLEMFGVDEEDDDEHSVLYAPI